jgi:hypothetical protein
MGIRMTPVDERHFRPDPEGKRKFVLHDWPAADIGTKHEFDLGPRVFAPAPERARMVTAHATE